MPPKRPLRSRRPSATAIAAAASGESQRKRATILVTFYQAVRCNVRRAIFQQFQTRVISTFCPLNTLIRSIRRRTDMIIKCNGER